MYIPIRKLITLTIVLFLVTSCVQPSPVLSSEQQKALLRQEVDKLLTTPGDINRISSYHRISPLIAAAYLAPERIPAMIAEGADVNYAAADGFTALHTVIFRGHTYRDNWAKNGHPRYDAKREAVRETAAIEALLKAGANPNAMTANGKTPLHLETNTTYNYYGDIWLEPIILLVNYGADLSLKDHNNKTPYEYFPTGATGLDTFMKKHLINDIAREGLESALINYYQKLEQQAQAARERKAAKDEQEKQRQLAQKAQQQKKILIKQSFSQDPALSATLSGLKQTAGHCFTLERMGNEIHSFNCNSELGGEIYSSTSCQDYQEQLIDLNNRQRNRACNVYKKQQQQLAALFTENASLANDVIQSSLSNLANIAEIEDTYRSELGRMKTIRDQENRSERAEDNYRYQQGMYNLARHIETSFGSKTIADQIIEKSAADTQRTLQAIDSEQKMAKINADLKAINKRLGNIEKASTRTQQTTTTAATHQGTGYKPQKAKVCAGPFSVPAKEGVYSIAEINSGAATTKHNCPANTRPVNESKSGYYLTFFLGGSYDMKKAENGKIRVTTGAYNYVCLCGSGQTTASPAISQ